MLKITYSVGETAGPVRLECHRLSVIYRDTGKKLRDRLSAGNIVVVHTMRGAMKAASGSGYDRHSIRARIHGSLENPVEPDGGGAEPYGNTAALSFSLVEIKGEANLDKETARERGGEQKTMERSV